jgi:hypothetical protein
MIRLKTMKQFLLILTAAFSLTMIASNAKAATLKAGSIFADSKEDLKPRFL